ncbi:MAG: rod-binding protein [Lachnospiraceae bacterium]|nr:rod-binding protein [Lachnospiraceae bacterium]
MDINTGYLTNLTNQAVADANTKKLKDSLSKLSESNADRKGSSISSEDDEKLMDACKQFESYFVEQMFKKMMDTVPKDPLDQGTNSMLVDYYKDNLVKEYASATTDKEELGLAKMLYEQMKRNIGITPEEADAKDTEKATETAAEVSAGAASDGGKQTG